MCSAASNVTIAPMSTAFLTEYKLSTDLMMMAPMPTAFHAEYITDYDRSGGSDSSLSSSEEYSSSSSSEESDPLDSDYQDSLPENDDPEAEGSQEPWVITSETANIVRSVIQATFDSNNEVSRHPILLAHL